MLVVTIIIDVIVSENFHVCGLVMVNSKMEQGRLKKAINLYHLMQTESSSSAGLAWPNAKPVQC